MITDSSFTALVKSVRACTLCRDHLPLGPRPVLQIHPNARILVVGQAPGIRVHETGLPFNDPSGDRLRSWMGISRDVFYDERKLAIIPMGFCYPGTGKYGDLPPRPECAEKWRHPLLSALENIEFTLLIGQYAQKWHLPKPHHKSLTETVKRWQDYWPSLLPLPHPSPHNNIWLKRTPWFEGEVLPPLKERVNALLASV